MTVDGILIVNKPAGKTSRWTTNQVSRVLREKKAGHLGTLDPIATGVLPVALGRATRLVRFLERDDKEYRAIIRLGRATDTQDATGQVVAEGDFSSVTRGRLEAAAAALVGELAQVPPMHSALKRDGQPLYKLARQGLEVERPARSITIFALVLEDFSPPDLTIRVRCSPGTYLRALAHDLGQTLGCGAHLFGLVRLRSGPFSLDRALEIDSLDPPTAMAGLIPLPDCLPHFPAIELTPDQVATVRDGGALPAPATGDFPPGQHYRLIHQRELVAVAKSLAHGPQVLLHPLRVMK